MDWLAISNRAKVGASGGASLEHEKIDGVIVIAPSNVGLEQMDQQDGSPGTVILIKILNLYFPSSLSITILSL